MVYDYIIILKKRENKLTDNISILMCVFALICFAYYYWQMKDSIYLVFLVCLVVSMVFTLLKRKKKGEALFRYCLVIAAAGWLHHPEKNFFMFALYLFASLFEKHVKLPLEIGFSEAYISFNSFPRRTLKWDEVNNVMLKDGLLTIDKKNNQLFQKEIEGYSDRQTENEFNAFCRQQLNHF